ncbi:MAG: CHASE3 domain-containing protein [Gemmatimonadaceae bacterium]
MKWTPLQKFSITSGAALVLIGLGGTVSYFYAEREAVADREVARTNDNMRTAFRILSLTTDAERLTKAFVVRPDSETRRALERTQSDVEDALDAMRRATEDNPRQRDLLDHAAPFVSAGFREFRNTVAFRDRFGADSARRYLMRESSPHSADSLVYLVGQMRDEELRVLAELTRHQSQAGATTVRLIQLGTVLTFLLAALALQPMRSGVAARLSTHFAAVEDGESAEAETAARLRALNKLIHAIAATPRDPLVGARLLVSIGTAPFAAALAAVVVPDGAGGFTVLMASDGAFTSVPAELARPIADTLRTAAFVKAGSRAERERLFGPLASLDAHGAPGALLFVPLWSDALAKGVVMLAFDGDRDFSTDDLDYAATLGRLGGNAVAPRPLTS